jgi:serine/threonine-protein kinase
MIVLGRYELHDVIGSGGMASVHLARLRGPAGFSRVVAIKRLHKSRDPQMVSSFVNEAKLASRIRHRNVVSVLDVIVDGGEVLLVMDFVHGLSLATLAQAPVPPPIASAIFTGILSALHAAHESTDEQGQPLEIVHRDVSPQNILVGADGVARLVDFGIAKVVGQAHTVTGFKGKLAYAAPEQIRSERVTRLADVYSTSVTLWEALTGRGLFVGESPPALLAQVLAGPVEPPSRYAPGLSSEVDRIVLRGLARDRTSRFVTAQEMERALARELPPAPPSAVAEWAAERAGEAIDELGARMRAVERNAVDGPGDASLDSNVHPGEAATVVDAPPAVYRGGPAKRARIVLGAFGAGTVLLTCAAGVVWHCSPAAPLPVAKALASAQPSESSSASDDTEPPAPREKMVDAGDVSPVRDRSPRRRPPPPRASVPSGDACDPPFTLDDSNHRVFKPNCLRK